MSDRRLRLEIFSLDGLACVEDDVEVVVVRRWDPEFEQGSEVAIFPLHAPTLIRLANQPLRYRKRGETFHVAAGHGFAEVLHDRVRVLAPEHHRAPS